MKHRYRVVVVDNPDEPFSIQKKGWIFWNTIDTATSMFRAEEKIREDLEYRLKYVPGRIVREYTEADLLVDKLKGK